MKKERKNKTNIVVTWPNTPFFTLHDVFALNRGRKDITIRVRLSKEIENGRVGYIGWKTGGQGRPRKVFANLPVSQTTLNLAQSQNINLVDQVILQKFLEVPVTMFVPKSQTVLA